MKRHFGNPVLRLLWSGDTLSQIEYEILCALVEALPSNLRKIVDEQIDAYNLVQREIDGRAINFYRKKGGKSNNMDDLPKLESKQREAPLVRLSVRLAGDSEQLNATLNVVNGRVFCMALSRSLASTPIPSKIENIEVTQSWKSNFVFSN